MHSHMPRPVAWAALAGHRDGRSTGSDSDLDGSVALALPLTFALALPLTLFAFFGRSGWPNF